MISKVVIILFCIITSLNLQANELKEITLTQAFAILKDGHEVLTDCPSGYVYAKSVQANTIGSCTRVIVKDRPCEKPFSLSATKGHCENTEQITPKLFIRSNTSRITYSCTENTHWDKGQFDRDVGRCICNENHVAKQELNEFHSIKLSQE